MNSPLLWPLTVLLVLLSASGWLLRRAHSERAIARTAAEAAATALELAHRQATLAEAQVQAGLPLDRENARLLLAWEAVRQPVDTVVALALPRPGSSPLLVTGQQRTTSTVATPTGPAPAHLLEFEATGPLGDLVAWLGQLETSLEPAGLRAAHFRPGVQQVNLRLVLAHPTDLP